MAKSQQCYLIKNDAKGDYKQISPALQLIEARFQLSQKNLPQANERLQAAITSAGKDYADITIDAKALLGYLGALNGSSKSLALCDEAVKMANGLGDASLISRVLLVHAEAALKANLPQLALTLAKQAQERFAQGGQLESEWRAFLVAAQASQALGDKTMADQLRLSAKDARSKLEQQWGADAIRSYLSRPDIQMYDKELGS